MFIKHNLFLEWQPPSLCMIEGDGAAASNGADSAGGGSGSGGADSAGDRGSAPPDWNQFLGGLKDLGADLGSKLDGLHHTVREGSTREPAAVAQPAPDFESMTQADLADYMEQSISAKVQAAINAALGPVIEQLTSLRMDFTSTVGKDEVNRLRTKYKDYVDWKDEMIALATEQPALGLEDNYRLVKSRDTEKAAKLELKYNPPAPKPRLPFAIGPGEGGRSGGSTKPLTSAEAGRQAYLEVSARHPGILAALGDL